jgi:hypothetical protein
MDRKTRGTVAVFIIAITIILAGVVNQYLVNNAGAGSDATKSENTAPAAKSETTDQQTTNPTDESDATEPETTTPTNGSKPAEPETTPPKDSTKFRIIVNEAQESDILVPVNVVDGLTREEAELIAEATFVQVKGEETLHRLDSLTLDENSIEAHYIWGLDESDMGHFFNIAVDVTSRLITVNHCF